MCDRPLIRYKKYWGGLTLKPLVSLTSLSGSPVESVVDGGNVFTLRCLCGAPHYTVVVVIVAGATSYTE